MTPQILTLPRLDAEPGEPARALAWRRLRQAIMTGAIAPGQALTIRAVAVALQTSPTPAREALRQLVSEGALVSLPNRRLVTPPMTAERYRQLIDTRIALEILALEQALPWLNDRLIDSLQALDSRINAAVDEGHFERVVLLNQTFHSRLITANPDQVALPLIEQLWLQLGPFMRIVAERISSRAWTDWHPALLDALARRDSEAARAALRADIEDSARMAEMQAMLQGAHTA